MCATGVIKGMRSGIDWEKTALQRAKNKEDLPPKKSSSPSGGPTSGGPTRLGIGRRPSTQKRSGVSGRSRSKSKAFSSTKR